MSEDTLLSSRNASTNGDREFLRPIVQQDSRVRLYSDLRRKIYPAEIKGILQQALMGNLFYQDELFRQMLDGWPRLQGALRQLSQAVSRVVFNVQPYHEPGAKEPSPSASAKADLVRRALVGFKPLVARSERDFRKLIADIVEARLLGISVSEILWEIRPASKGAPLEYMPRATQRLPALYYRYPFQLDVPDELLLNPTGEMGGVNLVPFPPNKFILAMYQGHSGHPSVSMPLRCLAGLWAANIFGLEWFSTSAQLFGVPMRKGTFQKGDREGYELLVSMLSQMGSAGWAALPEHTDVEFITAQGTGVQGPAERLVELSDRAVDVFVLGQTLTTDVKNSGSRALGQVHESVKQGMVEAVADFVAETLKGQLIAPLIELNYGETTELPDLIPDVEAPKDELVMAQRDAILFNQMKVPISLEFIYSRHSLPQPEAGEVLYVPPAGSASMKFEAPKLDAEPDWNAS